MSNRAGRNRSLLVTKYLALSYNLHGLNSFCIISTTLSVMLIATPKSYERYEGKTNDVLIRLLVM